MFPVFDLILMVTFLCNIASINIVYYYSIMLYFFTVLVYIVMLVRSQHHIPLIFHVYYDRSICE